MKEKIKNFLLIVLVGISMTFTKRLWMEIPVGVVDIFASREQAHEISYLLIDMIVPNKYLLNFNERNHTLFYDDSKHSLWTRAKGSLAKALSSKDADLKTLADEEFDTYNSSRSIVFHFPEKINTYILAKALDIKRPNDIVDTLPNISTIYMYLGSGDPFFVLSNNDINIKISNLDIDTTSIKEKVGEIEKDGNYNYYYSMKDTIGTNKDVYVPYEMKNNLPIIYVENEIRTLDKSQRRDLAENFFDRRIDYIREITERNGSTIYVHNEKVLKLNINGTLEYFHPLNENVKERNLYESMTSAAEFISKKAGVQKGMYLDKVEEIESDNSLGYKLSFKYRVRGIPVILGNREVVDFVEVEVFNNHIRSYKHFIRKDMNVPVENIKIDKQMLSSFDVIDINDEFILEKYIMENDIEIDKDEISTEEVLSSIEDITLAYFDPCLKDMGDELISVWAIKTKKGLYAFDAYKGKLVYEEN